eukprot:gene3126-13138_t
MLGVVFKNSGEVKVKEKKKKKGKDLNLGAQGDLVVGALMYSPWIKEVAAPLEREEWMTKPMARSQLKTEEEEAEEAEAEKKVEEPEIVIGLKIMKPGGGRPEGAASAPTRAMVGDGGLSWRMKALARAKTAAQAEGTDVASVVANRWGSLGGLTDELHHGRAAHDKAHIFAARDRQRAAGGVKAFQGPDAEDEGKDKEEGKDKVEGTKEVPRRRDHVGRDPPAASYLTDVHGERVVMRRPGERGGERLSWRKPGDSRDRDGEHGDGERDRDRDRDRDRRRDAGGSGMDRGGARDRERGREGDRDRGADRDRDGGREGDMGRGADRDRDGVREGDRDRGADRDRDGGREGDRDRGADRDRHGGMDGDRDRGADRDGGVDRNRGREGDRDLGSGRGRGGGSESRDRDRDGGGAGPRSKGSRASDSQRAALMGIASELNTFSGDGSFMENFRKQQLQQQGDGNKEGDGAGDGRPGGGRGGGGGEEGMQRGMEEVSGASSSDDDGGPEVGAPDGRLPSRGASPPAADASGGNHTVAEMLRQRQALGGGAADSGGAARGGGGDGGGNKSAAEMLRAKLQGKAPSAGSTVEGGGGGNKSAAEMLRAKLQGKPPPASSTVEGGGGGNKSAAEMLRAKLQGKAPPAGNTDEGGGVRREVVQLPLIDAHGKAVAGAFGREAAGASAAPADGRKAKRVQRYEDGQKTRYFADDDNVDLATLVKRAKHGDDMADMDSSFADNVARSARFKTKDMDADDEYDFDAGIDLYENKKKNMNKEQLQKGERDRQIASLNKSEKNESQCQFCPSTKGRIVPGHCFIVPAEHAASMRQVDDTVWTEVKNFIKCLIQMFAAQGQHCLFIETAMHLRSARPSHAVLECIPIGQRELDKAPAYFKKALVESESEWSTHHAKAAIETTAKKGLRESVPPNFPYTYVQFGYGSGYVHVIDDETKFDKDLCRQVAIGLLRLPAEEMHRRARMETMATQNKWVEDFKSMWKAYDCRPVADMFGPQSAVRTSALVQMETREDYTSGGPRPP